MLFCLRAVYNYNFFEITTYLINIKLLPSCFLNVDIEISFHTLSLIPSKLLGSQYLVEPRTYIVYYKKEVFIACVTLTFIAFVTLGV